jgi:hypothetical protein
MFAKLVKGVREYNKRVKVPKRNFNLRPRSNPKQEHILEPESKANNIDHAEIDRGFYSKIYPKGKGRDLQMLDEIAEDINRKSGNGGSMNGMPSFNSKFTIILIFR